MKGESGQPGSEPSALQRMLLWFFFFLALFFLTFPAIFLGGGQFYLRDFHPFFYPQKLFLATSMASGALPVWLPHVGCGVPFFAALQPGVAYPPSFLLLAGSTMPGLNLFVGFHFLLAFISAAILCRYLVRACIWSCCFCGTAYAFGGYLVSSVSQLNNLQSAAWAPLVLMALLRFARDPRLGGLLLSAFLVTLQILGGGVEVAALTLAAALVLSLSARSDGNGPAVGGPLLVSGAILLALALGAFQVLPTMEMAGRTLRAGGDLDPGGAGLYSLKAGNLLNLGAPRRLIDPAGAGYFTAFPAGVPWLISIYHGAVVIYLALAGLLICRRERALRLLLLAAAAVGVLLALGDSLPISAALLRIVPGTEWIRYPEKFLFLTWLVIPLLAAMGCRDLTENSKSHRGRPAAEAVALLIPLLVLTAAGWDRMGRGAFFVGVPALLLTLAALLRFLVRRRRINGRAAVLLLALLAAIDLSTAHRGLNGTVPADFYRDTPAAAAAIHADRERDNGRPFQPPRLRSTLPGLPGGPLITERSQPTPLETHLVWRAWLTPNSAGIHGISQVRGSTGMELRSPAHREQVLVSAGLPDQLALLSLWGVEYLLMDRPVAAPDDLRQVDFETEFPGQLLYRMRRPLPAQFLAPGHLVSCYPAAETELLGSGAGISGFVDSLRDDLERGRSMGERVSLTAWEPGRLAIDLELQREGLLLAVTEGFDPGWRAEVDGRPVAVQEGLGGFCLVPLPGSGRHQVELAYGPPGLIPGLAISLGTLLSILLAMVIFGFYRKKASSTG